MLVGLTRACSAFDSGSSKCDIVFGIGHLSATSFFAFYGFLAWKKGW